MRTGQQVLILLAFLNKKREEKRAQPNFATTPTTWLSNKLTNNWDTGCQQMRYCLDFVAGTAGMRYRTFFQKREYRTAAQWDPACHLMGALTLIKCCKLRGKWLYSSGPISPIWMRITLISPWTSTWWRPTWKVCQAHKSLNGKLLAWNGVQKSELICYPRGLGVRDSNKRTAKSILSNLTCQSNSAIASVWDKVGLLSATSGSDFGVRMTISRLLSFMRPSTSSRWSVRSSRH